MRLRFRDGQRETEEGDRGRWTHGKHKWVKRWVVPETRVCLGDRCVVAGGCVGPMRPGWGAGGSENSEDKLPGVSVGQQQV